MKPHKHAELIKKWADGAAVQIRIMAANNDFWRILDDPGWNADTEYRCSIGEVEGKPVFEGDVVYGLNGNRIIASEYGFTWDNNDAFVDWLKSLSWNPPKPKTVTVTLLREDAERISRWGTNILTESDKRITDACKEALK